MKNSGGKAGPIVQDVGFERIVYSLTEVDGEYGLSVCCQNSGEFVEVNRITDDIEVAEKIKNLFAEHTVFPANVFEILDDLLAEGI